MQSTGDKSMERTSLTALKETKHTYTLDSIILLLSNAFLRKENFSKRRRQ